MLRDRLIAKVIRVYDSCQTYEQTYSAQRYAALARARLGKDTWWWDVVDANLKALKRSSDAVIRRIDEIGRRLRLTNSEK